MTQPISLVLPDLFQDRLAKLTEHAAHVDMVIGAVAQHGLRVASVAHPHYVMLARMLHATPARS